MNDEAKGPTLKGAPTAQSVNLKVLSKDQNGVYVQYTFDTNQPKTYGNTLYVWEAAGPVIPWSRVPIASTTINEDQYRGAQRLDFKREVGVQYIIGYGVAAEPGAICASLWMPPGAPERASISP